MRRTTVGSLLLALGLLVGLGAAVGLALGIAPPPLSPFLLKVVVYKLTFAAALGLIVAGAFVQRWARRTRAPAGRGGGGGERVG